MEHQLDEIRDELGLISVLLKEIRDNTTKTREYTENINRICDEYFIDLMKDM